MLKHPRSFLSWIKQPLPTYLEECSLPPYLRPEASPIKTPRGPASGDMGHPRSTKYPLAQTQKSSPKGPSALLRTGAKKQKEGTFTPLGTCTPSGACTPSGTATPSKSPTPLPKGFHFFQNPTHCHWFEFFCGPLWDPCSAVPIWTRRPLWGFESLFYGSKSYSYNSIIRPG